jgi:hypothetical protein
MAAMRRPMQDYTSWHGFGTTAMWGDMTNSPVLAVEIACQHVSRLGCVNPSEQTSGEVAAVCMVAQFGASAPQLSQADVDKTFGDVKAVHKHNKI